MSTASDNFFKIWNVRVVSGTANKEEFEKAVALLDLDDLDDLRRRLESANWPRRFIRIISDHLWNLTRKKEIAKEEKKRKEELISALRAWYAALIEASQDEDDDDDVPPPAIKGPK